jgi:catechol 2,3-dioxygenase-like lactoylglutathione lyase family enzyme
MLKNSALIGFVATSKPDQAKAFYRDCLGLSLLDETPFAIVFESGQTQLRIQITDKVHAPPYTSLGWEVKNLSATVSALAGNGVTFELFDGLDQDDKGVWAAPGGARVVWLKDPDGNLLSITQAAR